MQLTPRGDYFHGKFHYDSSVQDELITKLCPGDLSDKLWEVGVNYSHVDKVVESAEAGFKTWRRLKPEERANFLEKFKEVAESKKDEIAMAIALETGKPLWEAKTEAGAVAAKVGVTLKESFQRIKKETISEVLPNIDGHVVYKPLGVCLVIGPFNFPCHLANGQILAALLSGNSIIFKPSEKTICSSQILIECFHEAGFPAGVVNFLNGTGRSTQDALKHPNVKGIYFTGSFAVGVKILESVGTDITKLVALELGGKNTTILHKDTNLDHALPELLRSCFLSSGQRCTSTSMIAVHKDIQDEMVNRFVELTKRIIIDHPTKYEVPPFMGPLIDGAAKEKYDEAVELGLKNGATDLLGEFSLDLKYEGHYVKPSVHFLEKVSKSNPYTQQEVFGPNCVFSPYQEIEEAIDIANVSDYGLAASIFTSDKGIYEKVLSEVDAGIINLNRSTVGASSKLPFGGVKNSGNHHPAAVSMIDHTVATVASLETQDCTSRLDDVIGLK